MSDRRVREGAVRAFVIVALFVAAGCRNFGTGGTGEIVVPRDTVRNIEATDLQRATKAYQEVIAAVEPQRDVLWLPQDSTTVEESTLLPLVLQEAWRRNFAVISSNAQHVRRGALFALYPDNAAMGRSLAQSAIDSLAGTRRPTRGLIPLRDVLVAANQRTAAHLGLELDLRSLRIAKLYPES